VPAWRRLPLVLAIVGVCVALDQLTKQWALTRLSDNRRIELIPTLELDLTFNSGFSFGTGAGRGQLVGLLVIGVSCFVGWQIWREHDRARLALLSVILSGALGNLLDRLFRGDGGFLSGEVVDFIDVTWYAVFNVADMFVVCGSIAFVVYELVRARPEPETEPEVTAEVEAGTGELQVPESQPTR
jgi:signal peptidase II